MKCFRILKILISLLCAVYFSMSSMPSVILIGDILLNVVASIFSVREFYFGKSAFRETALITVMWQNLNFETPIRKLKHLKKNIFWENCICWNSIRVKELAPKKSHKKKRCLRRNWLLHWHSDEWPQEFNGSLFMRNY